MDRGGCRVLLCDISCATSAGRTGHQLGVQQSQSVSRADGDPSGLGLESN